MNIILTAESMCGTAFCFGAFCLSMLLDKWKRVHILIGIISGSLVQLLLLNYHTGLKEWLTYTILLGCMFPAAYTDLIQKYILNFNCYLLYLVSVIFLIVDVLTYSKILWGVITAAFTVAVCFILIKIGWLGSGDVALLLPVAYLLQFRLVFIIGLGSLFSLILFVGQRFYFRNKRKTVAFAPGFFIATIAFIFLKDKIPL